MTAPRRDLHFGDCLDVLQDSVADASVDLVYLDPPFNSNRNYNLLFKAPGGEHAQAQRTAFKDTWHWDTHAEREYQALLRQKNTGLSQLLDALRRFLGEGDLLAYLVMLAGRLLQLHRVLKPTGSLYLHCDPTASHYIKILLDAVFGKENYRNEIVWSYQRWTGKAARFQRMHDVIFFYTKTQEAPFNFQEEPYSAKSRHQGRRHSTLLQDGSLAQEYTADTRRMKLMRDVWEISCLNSQSKERLGYPTQKPLALLERIIRASSNPGDVVLDPFCGCGSTLHAAEKLGRQWIGIEITHLASSLSAQRMHAAFGIARAIQACPGGRPASPGASLPG